MRRNRITLSLKRVLRSRNLIRIFLGKPDTRLIDMLHKAGKSYTDLGNRLGKSWHYHDSQYMRQEKPKKFQKSERLYATVRDTLYGLAALSDFASSLDEYYGTHRHILSERNFQWAGYLVTFALGIASTVGAGLIVDGIKNAATPPTTQSYYYVPSTTTRASLMEADCWNSIASWRGDARRCSVGNSISDPCFINIVDSTIVTCPSDPRNDKSTKSYIEGHRPDSRVELS
jgi:hypothetical protein